MPSKKWILKPLQDERLVGALSAGLNNLPEPLARSLVLRGVTSLDSAREFFRASLEDLHDPFLMADMDQAVGRVLEALDKNERIVVYGDYDVDGTTSTALMTSFLRSAGANVDYFIPDRFKHGYGLSEAGLDHAMADYTGLIIAIDCGITALKEAEYVAEAGVDLIVCDHHTPLDTLPRAVAVLNPKRADCPYPFRELCGCGVAFKLVQAIHTQLGGKQEELYRYLDLVAVATASDVVSATDENRILLREGLARLRSQPRIGFQALADGVGGARRKALRLSEATSTSIVFTVGPRINAAGRLGDAERAVSLLLAEDEVEAVARARQLERLNEQRRELDQEIQEDAFRRADRLLAGGMRHSFVLHNPDWHMGVIGIVASRLVERHMRPVLLLASVDAGADRPVARGSARSVNGINIYQALKQCDDLLDEFGGHDQAAGVTLSVENIPAFTQRFEEVIAGMVTPETLIPIVEVDAPLRLGDLDKRFWAVLKQFEPFGPDNPAPVFESRGLQIAGPVSLVGKDRSHIKFSVADSGTSSGASPGRSRPLNVIGFRMGHYLETVTRARETGEGINMLFTVQENTWNGRTSLQLQVQDIQPSEMSVVETVHGDHASMSP